MSVATLSRKFQFPLPKALRKAMQLQSRQQFELISTGSVIQLVLKTSIKALRVVRILRNTVIEKIASDVFG